MTMKKVIKTEREDMLIDMFSREIEDKNQEIAKLKATIEVYKSTINKLVNQ